MEVNDTGDRRQDRRMSPHANARKAIVTGASRGIGYATARALAEDGVDVAICARGEHDLEQAVKDLHTSDVRARGWSVDVGDRDAYERWLDEAVDWLGGLDVFVANVSALSPAEGLEQAWRRFYEVDLMHAVRGLERVTDALAGSEAGAAVFVSSASALINIGHGENGEGYSAMKAALISYAAQKAQQLGRRGVRVNTVTPGPTLVEGGVWDQVRRDDPDRFQMVVNKGPLGRLGRPDEVGIVVAFLAGPAASFITGANLRVDGGLLESVDF